jgi:hypothetical protein
MRVKHLRVSVTKELMERRIIVDWEGCFPLVWVLWSVIKGVFGRRSRDRRLGGNCAAFELLDSRFWKRGYLPHFNAWTSNHSTPMCFSLIRESWTQTSES